MSFYRFHFIFLTIGATALLTTLHTAGDPAAPAPALKLGTPTPRDEFYFKLNSEAVFFLPPDKDNSNFSEAVDGAGFATELTDGVGSLQSQSGNDVTWSLGGTVGFILEAEPNEAWLGKNLRIEASGDYFKTSHLENNDLSVQPGGNFIVAGRLDGDYTGTNQSTDIGSLSGGPNPVANVNLTTRDEFYQTNMAVRSDYLFDEGRLVLSPKLGFEYSHLTQKFNTEAFGNRGSVVQAEEVNTDYFGPKFALELKIQLAKKFVYFVESELSPFYASSDYSGSQNGTSTRFGFGSGSNSATDSKDSFAFKAGTTTGFYYDFGPMILKFGGGFEYWNYVATIQEAELPGGSNTVGVPAGASYKIQPSHLTSSDMFTPTANLSLILPF